MNRYTLMLLSLAGGAMCSLAWSSWCSGLILLIALVPFLIIEEWLFESKGKYTRNAIFLFSLPGMILFSMITMGWMRSASLTGAIFVIIGLAMLMSSTLWLAHIVRVRWGNLAGIIAFAAFWLTYEFISLNVNIVSPWMNLGNGLSKDLHFIQWYDITGTAGGSLWILCSNLLLTVFIVSRAGEEKRSWIYLVIWFLIILGPSIASFTKYNSIHNSGRKAEEAVIIQPNVDPFTEKFVIPFDQQLKRVVEMAKSATTENTAWIITPETTVDDPVDLDSINDNRYIKQLRQLTGRTPDASIVAGLVSRKMYHGFTEPPTISARRTGIAGEFSDHFNSAFRIDSGTNVEYYHKSKLVPGIEMQFANGPGRLISRILPYLGGTRWGYGIQQQRTCLHKSSSGMAIAPIICYESVFGRYVTGYVRNGAEALFIITNDGWWKNTYGYKQHLWYASLRAIETRRPVVRAANTGVSCIIDIRGRRTRETGWYTTTSVRGEIVPETRITPYVRYGDVILNIAAGLSAVILLAAMFSMAFKKKS
jgi:apolipoprotein N-acyltransferase